MCEHSRGVDEADLETFDFAEPAILLGLGDPVVQLLVRPDTAISAPPMPLNRACTTRVNTTVLVL
jgi:hypothetical protein